MFFYLFSSLIVLSALGVVFSQNPVRSVLWLIFAFINSSGLFILLDAEFVAMINIIVYVGAIAVLFLFVVMMIDVNSNKYNLFKQKRELLIGALMCIGMIFNVYIILGYGFGDADVVKRAAIPQKLFEGLTNTEMIGRVLYDHFLIPFQVMGIMLLVAILGAVSLTLRPSKLNKKPKKALIKDSIKLVDIQPGSSVLDITYD